MATTFTTLTSPATPTITSPTSGVTGVDRNPTITSSAFSSSESFTHTSSTWQIATDSGFSSVVWSKDDDTTNKTSIVVNSTNGTFAGALSGLTKLALSTKYYVRVFYKDSDGGSSAYSTGVSFTVRAATFNRNAVDVQSPWTIDGASSEMLPDSAAKPSMIGVIEETPSAADKDGKLEIDDVTNKLYWYNGAWFKVGDESNYVLRDGSSDISGEQTITKGLIVNEAGGNGADDDFRAESDSEANMVLVDASTDKAYIGGTTNGIEIAKGGELTLLGTATVWDDIRVTPGSFDRPGVTDPTIVAYNVNGGGVATYLWQFQKNAVASFAVQLPHTYKVGSDIKCHIHWTPGANGATENGKFVGWKIDYSWASINGTFGTMATLDLSDACDGTDHKHQMTPDVTITGTDKGISSMLICNVKRTDTGADDDWAGTASGALPMLLEIDFHYQIDTMGSKESSTK